MQIITPSRLHIALIDLNGSYGRVDGGIGITLEKPSFSLTAEPTDRDTSIDFSEKNLPTEVMGEYSRKITRAEQNIRRVCGIEDNFHFTVNATYPTHSGLGSGTQIALATGKLMTESAGMHLSSVDLAKIVGRAGTSGIGTYGFDFGGFIADGGHSKKQKSSFMPSSASEPIPPVLLGRYEFPEDWNIVLAIPKNNGLYLSGNAEINVFQTYCPIPKEDVKLLSHIIFMNMIPFLIEKDLEGFGKVLNRIQEIAFNKIEFQLQPPEVSAAMMTMRDIVPGVGLSSLGPTLFGVYDKNDTTVIPELEEKLGDYATFLVTNGQNHGAVLTR
ncbi:MAG TPA: beta-ribofuranosylaminobenzene 5'-phosphate synthase [Methanocorpusculum sp.]|nr:beta-ribofuranosylaminobenzene 5'-phosphate synthase [Methanocorpusculum sp.]